MSSKARFSTNGLFKKKKTKKKEGDLKGK